MTPGRFGVSLLVYVAVLTPDHAISAQPAAVDSLLRANAYPISYQDGRLSGAALRILSDMADSAQFFALGEEHNTRAIPHFTTALFNLLRETEGFQYLALEEGPYLGRLLSAAARRGGRDSVLALGRRFPNAFHMYTEDELEMIGDIGRASNDRIAPVWGLNQEFGVVPVYTRLSDLAPNAHARATVQQLLTDALRYEGERFQENLHYLPAVARLEHFVRLREMFAPKPGSEIEELIAQTQLSYRIYAPYAAKPAPPSRVFYESGLAREKNMKRLFAARYKEAERRTAAMPKVLVKSGHLHLYRGLSERTEYYSLGNFLSELAIFNGLGSVHIYAIVERPHVREGWLAPFVTAASVGVDILFDLRSLQPLVARNRVADISPQMRRLILGYDAVLLLRDGAQGSLDRLRTPRFRWYPEER